MSKIDVETTVPLRKYIHICILMSHHNNNRIGIDVSFICGSVKAMRGINPKYKIANELNL